MREKKELYFVGNAHLDPVWMWRWQEGSCETKATLRSALDRMKEYPDFVFVCSASCIFEWIEEFDPDMFREIRQRVSEGRFHLVGGWYVQPDCNLPCGEGFARQSLYGQRYFQEKFGVTARTGYNVDSFGHNGMLPQILRKSGMDQYIFMRPGPHEKELPANLFRWVSPDGSEVLASRIPRAYNTKYVNIDGVEHLERLVEEMEEQADSGVAPMLVFYGVGNHGGGPTKKNIESILALRESASDRVVVFSNLQDYFDRAQSYYASLPTVKDDLQHHASGCYSTVSAVKSGVRRAEFALYEAEIFSMLSHRLIGRNCSDQSVLSTAWKDVLFTHFHDSMGGCSTKEVHEDSLLMLGHARTIAARESNNALQTLAWKINTESKPYGFPIILFNPHSFPVTETVRLNKRTEHIIDGQGRRIPSQIVNSPTALCRVIYGDTIFRATVPAMGYVTFYDADPYNDAQRSGRSPLGGALYYEANAEVPCQQAVRAFRDKSYLVLENAHLSVTFDPKTGDICSLIDRKTGRQILRGHGGTPVVIDEADHDTWSHGKNYFDDVIGRFSLESMEVVENGPVRATVKVTSRYGDSRLRQYYSLTPDGDLLEVRVCLRWLEVRKMLKLRYETALNNPTVYYEIPFGVMERPCNGEEEPGLTWIAARDEGSGFAIINDSRYSSSTRGGDMNLTAIRSPYYQDHGRGVIGDECDVTDQGDTVFSYAVRSVAPEEGWSALVQQARCFNAPCTLIMESRHGGTQPDAASSLTVSASNVVISAIKRSEDGTGMIVRAYETDGVDTDVMMEGILLPRPLQAHFGPFSVNTYYLRDGGDSWREVLMTEYEME